MTTKPEPLTTTRLTLRTPTVDDAADIAAYMNTDEVQRYTPGITQPYDADDAEQLIADKMSEQDLRGSLNWAMETTNETVIGHVNLLMDPENRRAEIGYALHPDHWGNGYMTNTLTQIINHSFDDLQLVRIEAETAHHNNKSITLLERLGFTKEGEKHDALQVNNNAVTSHMYGLTRRQWPPTLIQDKL